jgi:N-acetyl-gamma-glutamyl-phosphate reductase
MIKVCVLGTGIVGEELISILLRHKNVELVFVGSDSQYGKKLKEVFPKFQSHLAENLKINKINFTKINKISDVVFICKPDRSAMEIVPNLLSCDKQQSSHQSLSVKIIDLGGDFRLKNTKIYEKFYGQKHKAPHLLKKAVYGLPEINRKKIKKANLVANPGCYAISIILALLPLLKEDFVNLEDVSVVSLSGVSGAGRGKDLSRNMFVDVDENVIPYSLERHKHTPEIEQELRKISKKNIKICFLPFVVPIQRGILSTLMIKMKKLVNKKSVISLYKKYYKDKFFVRIVENVNLHNVKRTNFCDISIHIQGRVLIVQSSIDNLGKGACSQAVQNMNLMFNLTETEGII